MQKLAVTYVDGREVDVPITPRAEVDWERHFDMSITRLGDRQEYFYYLGWQALRLSGQESAAFDDFLSTVADVVIAKDSTDKSDPTTPPQPPPASSD